MSNVNLQWTLPENRRTLPLVKSYNNDSEDETPLAPIEVPLEQLNSETVSELIESFILREGTDYGAVEAGLDAKKSQVRRQLDRGDIKIVFDPNTETVTLMTHQQWKKSQ